MCQRLILLLASVTLPPLAPVTAQQVPAEAPPLVPNLRRQPAPALAAEADADADGEEEAGGVTFPTDRRRERQLDQARRLIAESRWSDVATLLDGILEADRDFFVRPAADESTWRSVKSEAARLVGELPDAGREAYELQFRARADRALEAAIAANDAAAIVAVARRWFQTPAGRRATLMAAVDGIEAGQPLAAAAWLDRLATAPDAAAFEPALSLTRAAAKWRAGDRAAAGAVLDAARGRAGALVRIAGRETPLAYPAGGAGDWLAGTLGEPPVAAVRREQEWWLPRGDASRNAIVEASRPLLVPRYRVPLSRHPEESRLLERRRRQASDRDAAPWPAGTPLAVDGRLLVHSPLGLMAIDFATGKRVWLRAAGTTAAFLDGGDEDLDVGARDDLPKSVRAVFEDATAGGVSSDGRLVFAVEPDPDTLAAQVSRRQAQFNGLGVPEERVGNALVAYEVAGRGRELWRLPRPREGRRQAPEPAEVPGLPVGGHYLGAPLPLGDQLFVLVEERSEIRLDVVDAATGDVAWTQPLAVLDDEAVIDRSAARQRRLAGLAPSFGDGVLVCPTGAGAVVAVDLANRALLWAYAYPRRAGSPAMVSVLPNGMRIRRGAINARIVINGQLQMAGDSAPRPGGWRESAAIIAGGRVILTPHDSDELHCIDLRSGSLVWRRPRGDASQVAGVAGDAVVVIGRHDVDVLAIADGSSRLEAAIDLGTASPSGRGVLTSGHLFLPLDTPEVVDIDVALGRVVGRSPSRGGAVPGNLVAYRGEVVSQGVDSLDVFHQSAALKEQLQTAGDAFPKRSLWEGQLAIDGGDVTRGLRAMLDARQRDRDTIPAAVLGDAMLFALGGDFAAAAPTWRESLTGPAADIVGGEAFARMLRIACDGYLDAGDTANAWWAFREALALADRDPRGDAGRDDAGGGLVEDPADRRLASAGLRWLHGRFSRLLDGAAADLRAAIDRDVVAALAAAEAEPDAALRGARLETFLTVFGAHPSASRAREALDESFAVRLRPAGSGDAARGLSLRRELFGTAAGRDPRAAAAVPDTDAAWPVGRVVERRLGNREEAARHLRTISVRVADGGAGAFPGMRLCYDIQRSRLFAVDGYGRPLGDLVDRNPQQVGLINPMMLAASAVGRIVVVHSGSLVAAFELSGDPAVPNRRLWTLTEASAIAAELPLVNVGRQVGARGVRDPQMPLGMRIMEAEDAAPREEMQLALPRAAGLPIRIGSAVELHDPVTGALAWERHRLPANGDLFGDDEYLCVAPPDGRSSVVLSMIDGRQIGVVDLPGRQERLAAHGRRLVVLDPIDVPTRRRVRIVLLDPVTMQRTPLGEFSGESLATVVGDRALVIEPGGDLTAFDLDRGQREWTTRLAIGDRRPTQLQMHAWEDRYLVFVGRAVTDEESAAIQRSGAVMPLPQPVMAADIGQPATGTLWALDRRDGSPLWPAPATILQHMPHPQQPALLPVLVFARQIQQARGAGQARLSLLALDKRTGHALCVDDGIEAQPHLLLGCDVTANPADHTITLGRGGGEVADRVLEFTGRPITPRPPYQATAVQPAPLGLRSSLQRIIERALVPQDNP